MGKLWEHIKDFSPPMVLSCVSAVLFSAASLVSVATELGERLSSALTYVIYICAAVSLSLAVWAVVRSCRKASPVQRAKALAHRYALTGRMVDDFSFRTVTFTYASFGGNVVFSLAKGVAGWFSGSWWLISFSTYYLLLCISKFLLLRDSRKLDKLQDQSRREQLEWQAYRVCGVLLMVMTIALFGIVVLIVTRDSKFVYYGVLIFVVALYDFYCLTAAIIYMVRNRRRHSPMIVAIKTIQLATTLVSMLSLQTAMFASFGGESDGAFKSLMNLCTGGAVCVILLTMGIVMVVKATKEIKTFKPMEETI